MASPNKSIERANAIKASIDSGETQPVYVLHGNEPYLCDELCNYLLERTIPPEARDFNQTIFYGLDTTDSIVAQQCKQVPFGAPKRLVVVREAQMLKSLKIIAAYASKPIGSTILVLNFHATLKPSEGTNGALLNAAKKNGVVYQSEAFREYQIDGWIKERAKAKGLEIHPLAIGVLKEHVGTELDKIENALETLRVSMGESEGKITKEKVFDTIGVSREFNVFNLTKAIGMGDKARALQIVHYMATKAKGNATTPILDRVAHYFFQILQFQTLDGQLPHDEVAKAMGVNPFFLQEFQQASMRYPLKQLPMIFTWLRYIDMMSKGLYGAPPSQEEVLKELLLRIMK